MRKAVFLLVVFLLIGCGPPQAARETVIAVSFYPVYLAAANVAAGAKGVRVVNITKPSIGCLHDYQLTTEEVKTLTQASVLVVNGGGMEPFAGKIASQLSELRVIDASRGIELITDAHAHDNPHIWVSPSGAIKQVENIANGLAEADPANAEIYRRNAADYAGRLASLRERMKSKLKGARSREIVTFHEAFAYFAREFELNVAAVIQSEPGSEPSAGELAETVKLIKSRKIKAIFAEPQYPARAAQTVARETGAVVHVLDPVSTGPMDDPDFYFKAMEGNLETLMKAFE